MMNKWLMALIMIFVIGCSDSDSANNNVNIGDGICLIGEEGTIDCTNTGNNSNGICEVGETGTDCNGMCEPDDDLDSLDCGSNNNGNGICEAGETGTDCDALCLTSTESLSIDCSANGHELVSISVTPTSGNLPLNIALELTSIGLFEGGRTLNISRYAEWFFDVPDIVSVVIPDDEALDNAIATALSVGSTDITASVGEKTSIAVRIIVADESIISGSSFLEATPSVIALGLSSQVYAKALFTDGNSYSTENIIDSNIIAWSITASDAVTGAKISSEGLVTTSTMTGPATLTVTAMGVGAYEGETASINLLVTDESIISGNSFLEATPSVVALGLSSQVYAKAQFTNGDIYSTEDFNDIGIVNWSVTASDDVIGAYISAEGLVTTSAMTEPAMLTITATGIGAYEGEVISVDILVTDETIISGSSFLEVNPSVITLGLPSQVYAKAQFSDGNTYSTQNVDDAGIVNWSVTASNGVIGSSISAEGRVITSSMTGPAIVTVTATGGGAFLGESATIDVVVTEETIISGSSSLVAIPSTVALGINSQVYATAKFTGGHTYSTKDLDDSGIVNWSVTASDGVTGANISGEGLVATSSMSGPATLTVTAIGVGAYLGEVASTNIVVTEEEVVLGSASLEAIPSTVALGFPSYVFAKALFTDGNTYSTADFDDNGIVYWSVTASDGVIGASISAEGEVTTSTMTGPATLTVTGVGTSAYGGETQSIEIVVTDALVIANTLSLAAAPTTIEAGDTSQLSAVADFTDGNTYSINNEDIDWSVTASNGNMGATISRQGLVSTVAMDGAITTLTVSATYEGEVKTIEIDVIAATAWSGIDVCGNTVNDRGISNAIGTCLKVADDSVNSRLFTGTPSLAVMTTLGYVQANGDSAVNSGKSYNFAHGESGLNGPVGDFVRFDQMLIGGTSGDSITASGVDGQFDRWCQDLARIYFYNKSDWRRPTIAELLAFYSDKGDMYPTYGWATVAFYWTSEVAIASPTEFTDVGLRSGGGTTDNEPTEGYYGSCVSGP
ncbi:hypothetical protein HQQ94_12125 [Shewanella sp. VB17]|uniref:hypothetical protein n=1 Tax=Shewanella sp. VB17 TaxID=2739432 RepID=UPI001566A6E6|nr:hypothetical protein [Shewanella sp. VB17]NRD73970.1 hypothetical protein [Shewanella sp. VB17]